MKSELLNLEPVNILLDRHSQHTSPYFQEFMGLDLIINPEVFNPAYTKVTRLLAENLRANEGDEVLDMFCGSGVLGLLLSDMASKIAGVDISPYAVENARQNANKLGINHKTDYRNANLWDGVKPNEQFDLIVANPPLLPATPETLLEMAVADSPEMFITTQFIKGSRKHLKDDGRVIMALSDASKIVFRNPLDHIKTIARDVGLSLDVIVEKDVGYEIYRVIEFRKDNKWQE